jgi:SAM-dependent methyltransferase
MTKPWFESWFDSPYYHILYANRDYNEAEAFIINLIEFLDPKNDSSVLDLGCGKGRHSIFLSNLGLNVTGIDLSQNSIDSLKSRNSNRLRFERWDMRNPYKESHFDFVFNLFTSFGYFENESENIDVLRAVNFNLKDNGVLVLDYLNAFVVRKNINNREVISRNNIEFNISKREGMGAVLKKISFKDDGQEYSYEERVQLIDKKSFLKFDKSNFKVEHVFGDYTLSEFDEENSPRLIFVVSKK